MIEYFFSFLSVRSEVCRCFEYFGLRDLEVHSEVKEWLNSLSRYYLW